MGEILDFDRDFVERTKYNLIHYCGPYDVCDLINCTLGLIILPFERLGLMRSSLWDKEYTKITNLPLPPRTKVEFAPINHIDKKSGKPVYDNKTLKVLLRKIRNGLAHQNIEAVNEKGEFTGVRIRNYFEFTDKKINKRKRIRDLKVQFTKDELRAFALFIAASYLNELSSRGK